MARFEFDFCSEPQHDFVADNESDSSLYSGAVRAGKSTAICIDAAATAFNYPGSFTVVTRKTFSSMRQTTMRTFFNMFPESAGAYRFNERDQIAHWDGGSKTYFVGCDEEERIKSLQADKVLVDQAEELKEHSWELLDTRCNAEKVPHAQMKAVCNPDHKGHWLYRYFFRDRMGPVFKTRTLDNIFLPEDYIRRLSRFKGKFRQKYIEGDWIGSSGLIYGTFDPTLHVIPSFDIPEGPDYPRLSAQDYGYTNPASNLTAFRDNKGQVGQKVENAIYVYQEVYRAGMLTSDFAKLLKKLWGKSRIESVIADHDAQERAIFRQEGIPTKKAKKDVKLGIEEVTKALDGIETPEGPKPLLYFFDDVTVDPDQGLEMEREPTGLFEEIVGYEYAEALEGREAKEQPIKHRDHSLDALRYLLMAYKTFSARRFEFVG